MKGWVVYTTGGVVFAASFGAAAFLPGPEAARMVAGMLAIGAFFGVEIDSKFWAMVAGYAYSVFAGHVLVSLNVDALRKNKGLPTGFPNGWHARLLGMLERALYTATFHANHISFIAVWLGLKAVSQWKLWYEGTPAEVGKAKIEGRSIFNIFLIGNAFSVSFALLGARMITWVGTNDIPKAIGIGGFFVLCTVCTFAITFIARKKKPLVVFVGQGICMADCFNLTNELQKDDRAKEAFDLVPEKNKANLDLVVAKARAVEKETGKPIHEAAHEKRPI